eukprot:355680-Chlamydomonas_euryale.AAC.1
MRQCKTFPCPAERPPYSSSTHPPPGSALTLLTNLSTPGRRKVLERGKERLASRSEMTPSSPAHSTPQTPAHTHTTFHT